MEKWRSRPGASTTAREHSEHGEICPEGLIGAYGGSSSINAMIYMRGQAADYDGWRQLGLPGWGWDDVLPWFLAHEDHIDAIGEHHRAGGEWRVEHPRIRWAILDAIRDAAAEIGIAPIPDFNGGDNEGSSYFQVNQRAGRRVSAARAFLKPVLNRPNLRLETGAEVERLTFAGKRATGLIFRRGEDRFAVRAAGEVILSAGAVMSPKLLLLSGVGDAEALTNLGIPVVHDLRGVGGNLQDHLQIRPVFKVSGVRTLNSDYRNLARRAWMGVDYALFRRGPLTMAPSQLGMFARSSHRFCNRQSPVPLPAAVARQMGRRASPFRRLYRQRLQSAAIEPGHDQPRQPRSARLAADRTALSDDRGGSLGSGRRSQARASDRRAGAARALSSRGAFAGIGYPHR